MMNRSIHVLNHTGISKKNHIANKRKMMMKILSKVIFIFGLLFMTACNNIASTDSNSNNDTTETQEEISEENNDTIETQEETPKEDEDMIPINLTINSQIFPAVFYDNETTQAFIEKMPLTLNMNDLNNNEKYYNLPDNLPTQNTEQPDVINEGEIMVWRSNTIVVFYETFSNSFGGYTRLGYIENTDGLVEALGSQSVDVTFEVN